MKSSFSNATGNCVDVGRRTDGMVVVTDTKQFEGRPVELVFTPAEWAAFLNGVHRHEFDYDALEHQPTDSEIRRRESLQRNWDKPGPVIL